MNKCVCETVVYVHIYNVLPYLCVPPTEKLLICVLAIFFIFIRQAFNCKNGDEAAASFTVCMAFTANREMINQGLHIWMALWLGQ